MIGDTIGITYDGTARTLVKINQDNYGATYFLDIGTRRFTMSVKHTIPGKGKFGESHLMRLDTEVFDAEGALVRVASAWAVIRTDEGNQDSAESEDVTAALLTAFTSTNYLKMIGRES